MPPAGRMESGPRSLGIRSLLRSYYAPRITSRVIVGGDRLYGYDVVDRIEYSSWLQHDPQYVYLLKVPDR